ncbi:hypothetical protein DI270_035105 [Microbispora triticiradicis]|uniref:Uncharacterized protein n=1 Tax=Microbispora triticiradicis TaxID=2200763 RepID=A0ABX9L8S5_9ACTN|nr:hypothetical protein DI270_035105 [Microbispora triticiradicis]GLW22523.1 hypothetical protein Mame01_25660 [Microbispora amethystogenes]
MLDRWQAVRHHWQRLLFDQRRMSPANHLDQMTSRLGRLISTNPEGTFELRNLPALKSPAELAPAADMSRILLSVRHAVEALAVLGQRDLAQVTAPGRIGGKASVASLAHVCSAILALGGPSRAVRS